jgi:hypothetical protein
MRAWRRVVEPASRRPGTIAVSLFAAGAILAGAVVADGVADQAKDGRERDRTTIASVSSNGLRVKLVAHREGNEDPPLATVRISAYERKDGSWDRLGRPRVVGERDAWFSNVVTSRFGVDQLGVRMPGGMFPLQVRLRLSQSASLGASEPFFFTVEDGRLRPIFV